MTGPNPRPVAPGPVDLTIAAKAAERSRSGGVWSLGHLRICWAALLAAGLLLAVIGVFVGGHRALIGGLIGTAVVGLFFTVSAVVIARVGRRNPQRVMWAALGTYLVKVVLLGFVLVVIPRNGPVVDTRWMAGAVGLGLFIWLGAHMRYVLTTKIFYVDPN